MIESSRVTEGAFEKDIHEFQEFIQFIFELASHAGQTHIYSVKKVR